jgi:DNA-directed RNA polymerase specialized sigma24 family protein
VHASPSGSPAAEPRQLRDAAERILDLADHLAAPDRALLRGIYDRGMTAADLARVLGRRPRGVRRRVQRLVQRIGSPRFMFIVRNRRRWPKVRRSIAEMVFLQGRSQRDAAETLGLGVHRVRREVDRIRLLIDEARARGESDAER